MFIKPCLQGEIGKNTLSGTKCIVVRSWMFLQRRGSYIIIGTVRVWIEIFCVPQAFLKDTDLLRIPAGSRQPPKALPPRKKANTGERMGKILRFARAHVLGIVVVLIWLLTLSNLVKIHLAGPRPDLPPVEASDRPAGVDLGQEDRMGPEGETEPE
jgi:hypothetical protein